MRNFVVRLALLSFLAGPELFAQAIPFGSIVKFTSPSGSNLSAVPAQVLGLSSNTGAWEQWEYLHNRLNSFHGTTMTMTFSGGPQVFHAPSTGDGIVVEGVDAAGHFGTPVVQGGSVAILSVDLHTYVVQDNNGVIAVSGLQDPNFVPPAARWSVSVVPVPAGGRQRLKNAIKGFAGSIRSSHGTYLTINGTDIVHQAQNPAFIDVRTELNASNERPVWRFGQSIYVFRKSQFGSYETMQPGGAPDHGMETVVFKPMVDRVGWSEKWTLVPLGYYKDGDRVPEGEPVMLRSAKGTFLSADPGLPKLRLTTSTGSWEHWAFYTSSWKN